MIELEHNKRKYHFVKFYYIPHRTLCLLLTAVMYKIGNGRSSVHYYYYISAGVSHYIDF